MVEAAALSALAGIGSLFSANASSKKQYQYQSALQAQAAKLNYDYSIKSAENMPSATRRGLESGGYNPMLAVQNATSGANSSWTSSGNAQNVDYSNVITQGIANAQSFQRLKNETQQAESSSDAYYASADKAKAEKAEIVARLPFVSKREKAEIAKIESQSAKLENDIHYQNELINYYNNSLKLQEMGLQPQFINAGANATNAKTNFLQYQIDKEVQDIVRDREKRYKEWGNKHPYFRNVDETFSRYFNGFGASASTSRSSVSKR